MNLALLVLFAAMIVFLVEAWLRRSLLALGLFLLSLYFIFQAGVIHLG